MVNLYENTDCSKDHDTAEEQAVRMDIFGPKIDLHGHVEQAGQVVQQWADMGLLYGYDKKRERLLIPKTAEALIAASSLREGALRSGNEIAFKPELVPFVQENGRVSVRIRYLMGTYVAIPISWHDSWKRFTGIVPPDYADDCTFMLGVDAESCSVRGISPMKFSPGELVGFNTLREFTYLSDLQRAGGLAYEAEQAKLPTWSLPFVAGIWDAEIRRVGLAEGKDIKLSILRTPKIEIAAIGKRERPELIHTPSPTEPKHEELDGKWRSFSIGERKIITMSAYGDLAAASDPSKSPDLSQPINILLPNDQRQKREYVEIKEAFAASASLSQESGGEGAIPGGFEEQLAVWSYLLLS